MKSRLLILIIIVVCSVEFSGCYIPPLSYQTAKTLDKGEAEYTPFVHSSAYELGGFGAGFHATQGLTEKIDWSIGGGVEINDEVGIPTTDEEELFVNCAIGLRLRCELLEDKVTLSNTLATTVFGLYTIFPEMIYSTSLKREDRIITLGLGCQYQGIYGQRVPGLVGTTKIGFQFNPKLRVETGVIFLDQRDYDGLMIAFGLAMPLIFNEENDYNPFNMLEKRRVN
tara:strand:+ start:50 stop:727 length:678 start_codon:yes stop_codon:yes gene_type:complete